MIPVSVSVQSEDFDVGSEIDALTAVPVVQLDRVAEAQLLRMLSTLWGSGWQPAEAHRQARLPRRIYAFREPGRRRVRRQPVGLLIASRVRRGAS